MINLGTMWLVRLTLARNHQEYARNRKGWGPWNYQKNKANLQGSLIVTADSVSAGSTLTANFTVDTDKWVNAIGNYTYTWYRVGESADTVLQTKTATTFFRLRYLRKIGKSIFLPYVNHRKKKQICLFWALWLFN